MRSMQESARIVVGTRLQPSVHTLFASMLVLAGSCPGGNLAAQATRDTDNDGWYDATRNQKIELFIDRVESTVASSFAQTSAIAIDNRLIVGANQQPATDIPVATRIIGTWGLPERVDPLHATLRLRGGEDLWNATPRQISFTNENTTFAVTEGNDVIHFRTTRTLFGDPSPQDANGDADQDGLTDTEEVAVNSPSRSIGHPNEPDLLLVVGFTHPDWGLTRQARDKLTTVFFNKKRINLNIYTAPDLVLGLAPGQILISGAAPQRNHAIAMAEVDISATRSQFIPDPLLAPLFHVLVLAENTNVFAFGEGEAARPANDLICQSHLPALGPDHFDYQAKTIMHELGHNLGLCHPAASDGTCATGAIPVAERNGGQTAMGTPADAPGPIEVMIEALSRPLDYTPGQWQNLDLRFVKPAPPP